MANDCAIVVGLSHYPAIGQLAGPENDAQAFYDWVTSAGGVKPENASLILSSQFKPPAAEAIDARPGRDDIEREFRKLIRRSEQSFEQSLGRRLGGRLWVFMAGHGFVPNWAERMIALLTADADEGVPQHVAGQLYQRYARDEGIFDEVLLFMDCCGKVSWHVDLHLPSLVRRTNIAAANNGRLLVAAASRPGFITRETTAKRNGDIHGVFTLTLLDALRGGVPGGRVTSHSLADYLREHMRSQLEPEDLDDVDVAKEPFCDFEPAIPAFEILHVPPATHPVKIVFPAADVGSDAVVLLGGARVDGTKVPSVQTWDLQLETGIHQLVVGGRVIPFDVPMRGDRVAA